MARNTDTVEDKMISEGWMHKVGKWNTGWKQRYFVLDKVKRHLVYYSKKPYSKNKKHIKPKGYIDLLSVKLRWFCQGQNKSTFHTCINSICTKHKLHTDESANIESNIYIRTYCT